MATIESWTPYGVALDITATAGTITRTSATRYTVVLNVSWKVHWSGASTNYGMWIYANDVNDTQKAITAFGSAHSSGSTTITGTYSISGTGAQTKSVTATFENYNSDTGASSKKSITLNVSAPAWPTYKVSYNANGGSGAPSGQTKVKGTILKLSSTKPTRTGYSFQGWGTSASDTSVDYAAGASYTKDAAITLYAIWKANTYTVKYNANGGTGAPASQTKTYGVTLKLSTTKPTRTNYNFLGWASSSSAVSAQYAAGANYTANSAVTLYAVWELAYWKPKLTNVSVARCDADGTLNDFGTCAKVSFGWQLCQLTGSNTIATAVISWDGGSKTVSLSGESGNVSLVVGSDAISIESSYEFVISVTDAKEGITTISRMVSSAKFAIDFLAGGKGIAFGKVAEKVIEERDDKEAVGLEIAMPIYTAENNNVRYYGTTPEGKKREIINPCNASGNLVLGYGGYLAGDGATVLYGNGVQLQTKGSSVKTNKPVETYFRSCRCNTELSLTTASQKLDMSYTNQYRGSFLTLSGDGGIKCEIDGCVIVYGTVYALDMTAGNTLGAFVRRNRADGTGGSWGLSIANTGTRAYTTAHIAPACISVTAGDVIYLYAYNINAASGVISANTRTALTVQYI